MKYIRLTPESLERFRQSLADTFPGVQSTHMREALAAALRFRTFVSLVAHMQAIGHVILHELDVSRFNERLHELGYPTLSIISFAPLMRQLGAQVS